MYYALIRRAFCECVMYGEGLGSFRNQVSSSSWYEKAGVSSVGCYTEIERNRYKTGSRLFEIPHRNDIYIINPSMRKYLNVSVAISKIALRYVPPEDLHQYSIDEFLWMSQIVIIGLVLQFMRFAND